MKCGRCKRRYQLLQYETGLCANQKDCTDAERRKDTRKVNSALPDEAWGAIFLAIAFLIGIGVGAYLSYI